MHTLPICHKSCYGRRNGGCPGSEGSEIARIAALSGPIPRSGPSTVEPRARCSRPPKSHRPLLPFPRNPLATNQSTAPHGDVERGGPRSENPPSSTGRSRGDQRCLRRHDHSCGSTSDTAASSSTPDSNTATTPTTQSTTGTSASFKSTQRHSWLLTAGPRGCSLGGYRRAAVRRESPGDHCAGRCHDGRVGSHRDQSWRTRGSM